MTQLDRKNLSKVEEQRQKQKGTVVMASERSSRGGKGPAGGKCSPMNEYLCDVEENLLCSITDLPACWSTGNTFVNKSCLP